MQMAVTRAYSPGCRSRSRRLAATIARHQSSGSCSAPPPGQQAQARPSPSRGRRARRRCSRARPGGRRCRGRPRGRTPLIAAASRRGGGLVVAVRPAVDGQPARDEHARHGEERRTPRGPGRGCRRRPARRARARRRRGCRPAAGTRWPWRPARGRPRAPTSPGRWAARRAGRSPTTARATATSQRVGSTATSGKATTASTVVVSSTVRRRSRRAARSGSTAVPTSPAMVVVAMSVPPAPGMPRSSRIGSSQVASALNSPTPTNSMAASLSRSRSCRSQLSDGAGPASAAKAGGTSARATTSARAPTVASAACTPSSEREAPGIHERARGRRGEQDAEELGAAADGDRPGALGRPGTSGRRPSWSR